MPTPSGIPDSAGAAQPELGEREERAAEAGQRQTPIFLPRRPRLVAADGAQGVPGEEDDDDQHGADARGDEHEGRGAGRQAIRALEDDRVGAEVEEEDDVLVEDAEKKTRGSPRMRMGRASTRSENRFGLFSTASGVPRDGCSAFAARRAALSTGANVSAAWFTSQ